MRFVALHDMLIEKASLSQYCAEGQARGTSRMFRIRLLPTNPPGDWTGVQHPLHGENNGCEEKEGCEEGRRQEEEVGSVRW